MFCRALSPSVAIAEPSIGRGRCLTSGGLRCPDGVFAYRARSGAAAPGIWQADAMTNTGWRTDPMTHVVSRLCNALMMVVGLIPWTEDPTLDRIACVEDWFTNYRLLIEFLVLKPPDNCASVTTFAAG